MIISLPNFLYKIELNDRDKKLLWESFRKNKKLLKSMEVSKKQFKAHRYEPREIVVEKVIPLYVKRFEKMRDLPD
ncbi:MAG: hypothetical protein IKJ59_16155 [Clostridia bacterium]|nr:hypothetical protein [Clostridia bacterium]